MIFFRSFLFLSIILISWNITYSQSKSERDSLVNELCIAFNATEDDPDSMRIHNTVMNAMIPYLKKHANSQNEANEIINNSFIRLSKSCKEFIFFGYENSPQKGDWILTTSRPPSKISKRDCKKFSNIKDFKYIESTGDTIRVTINNGIWYEKFKDGTYSKLKFEWIDSSSFKLTFIESTHPYRVVLSDVGDEYIYQLTGKSDKGFFTAYTFTTEIDVFSRFKLYY
ncbi:hypothetical protein [Mangrovivirga cuniculi]|uniref:Uncharacterized protein n=1 Tax=Mangrovivirga cuniculi TaxID=2715131 RepID=A0A4D7JM91_9BACT|nr:hypothetical protein [Mangrovivirga cuniculi]QCK14600.1 hypothetical protein DCC35_07510 [Mangrovivirga cuniculi]